jgi:predicted transcriptional regulator
MLQHEIAKRLDVSQSQVSQDLTAVRKAWEDSAIFNFNEAKNKELAKIDMLEATYWQAWEDSKKPIKKKHTVMSGSVDTAEKDPEKRKAQSVKTMRTSDYTEERLGDPRCLDGMLKCSAARRELLGLNAPFKVAQTDPEGKAVQARQWTLLDHTGGKPVPAPDQLY